uniref:Uncharacterized protein n=1 Tax=Monodon monoceros TaxID=40151 RepID=A0A8C6BDS4_MONMO
SLLKKNNSVFLNFPHRIPFLSLVIKFLLKAYCVSATPYVWTTVNKNAWATLSSIVHMILKNKYCPDLHMVAVSRAGTTLGSQEEAVMVKRKPTHPTKSS